MGTECTRSTTAYWQSIEAQVVGLCFVDWQSDLELANQIFWQGRENFQPKALCKPSRYSFWVWQVDTDCVCVFISYEVSGLLNRS
jgi:hypothetical protein